MSKKNKNNTNKKGLLYLTVIFISISLALYILVWVYNTISMSVVQTHIIDLGEVKKTINKDAVVIRKSVPIVSKRNGILTTFYPHGERVTKNAVICKVLTSANTDNEIADLERINNQIEQINNSSLYSYSPDIMASQMNNDINFLYLDIQEKIRNNDLKYLSKLKSELETLTRKKSAFPNGKLSTVNIQDLYNKKAVLEKKLASDNAYIRSQIAGEISYYSDSFEQLLSFENMTKLTVKDIESVSNNFKKIDIDTVKNGDVVGYIVDNHNYYMATSIEKQDIESIKRDVTLTFIIDNVSFNAYFHDFYKDVNGKFVGLFKVESEDFDFLKNRKENVDIIYDHAKGISIPNSAITEFNHKRGVFVVSEIGVANFRALTDVLLADDTNTIIKFSYDDFNDNSKIKLYDEIILSPNNIKEGQKVR